jgi:hypothetical protein
MSRHFVVEGGEREDLIEGGESFDEWSQLIYVHEEDLGWTLDGFHGRLTAAVAMK